MSSNPLQRTRQVARTPHTFVPTGRIYEGEPLCRLCNTTEGQGCHAYAAIALARLRRTPGSTA